MTGVAARALVLLALALGGCASQPRPVKEPAGSSQTIDVQRGKATWYGGKHHGKGTASGERFNKHAMTAAHRTYPFQTRVRVTNQKNGRSVVVRITDRGPFVKGRIIDVSEAAAKQLGMLRDGVVPVKIERLRAGAGK